MNNDNWVKVLHDATTLQKHLRVAAEAAVEVEKLEKVMAEMARKVANASVAARKDDSTPRGDTMAPKYQRGVLIEKIDDLVAHLLTGENVYYRDRVLHPSFVGYMNLYTVLSGLRLGNFATALTGSPVSKVEEAANG